MDKPKEATKAINLLSVQLNQFDDRWRKLRQNQGLFDTVSEVCKSRSRHNIEHSVMMWFNHKSFESPDHEAEFTIIHYGDLMWNWCLKKIPTFEQILKDYDHTKQFLVLITIDNVCGAINSYFY